VAAAILAASLKILNWSSENGLEIGRFIGIVTLVPLLLSALWYVEHREDSSARRRKNEAAGAQVKLPGGEVIVAGDDISAGIEGPPRATVGDLMVDQFEVTNRQFALCVDAGVCDPPADETAMRDPLRAEWPVGGVSLSQANTFCEWLDRRLPTELEWLRAAVGPAEGHRLWPWGDEVLSPSRANLSFVATSLPDPSEDPEQFEAELREQLGQGPNPTQRHAVPVAELAGGRTPDGVAHLLGNHAEWTTTSPQLCSLRFDCSTRWRPSTAVTTVILRGESFESPVVLGDELASASLVHTATEATPALREHDVGFRCVDDPELGE
jgi:formylglycine-generating enzyme required for sulfatase activity